MKIYSELHGKEVELSYALSAIASQEGSDGNEYDLMQKASYRIIELESAIQEFVELSKQAEGWCQGACEQYMWGQAENFKKLLGEKCD